MDIIAAALQMKQPELPAFMSIMWVGIQPQIYVTPKSILFSTPFSPVTKYRIYC